MSKGVLGCMSEVGWDVAWRGGIGGGEAVEGSVLSRLVADGETVRVVSFVIW